MDSPFKTGKWVKKNLSRINLYRTGRGGILGRGYGRVGPMCWGVKSY